MPATAIAGEFFPGPSPGIIKEGAPADLLIFAKDPTNSLENLNSLQAVIADGRLYTKETLDECMAQYRSHFHGGFYSKVMGVLVALAKGSYAN